jgi:tRNA dimethylallyltransferase
MPQRPRVLAIVGPTGTGKTELACAVARRTGAEVIGADSLQVYRYMDVGTAKATPELRAEIPHHLIDVVNPDEPMSAGRYTGLAREAAWGIQARRHPIVLCGGSGLYARAFAGGLVAGLESNPDVRRALEARSAEELRSELRTRDPAAADRIHPNDRVRLIRALEVAEVSGSALSESHDGHRFRDRPFDVRWLALDLEREHLWAQLRARVEGMFREGLIEEVQQLYAAGYGPSLPPLQAIGYREAGLLLAGQMDEATAREAAYLATRRYSKRQRTWFRAEPEVVWMDAARPAETLAAALRGLEA